MDIKDIQNRQKPNARRIINLAESRCAQAGIALTKRQAQIVQGAILNDLVTTAMQRAEKFIESISAEAERLKEIQAIDTDELADLLIDSVWSTLEIGTEESATVEAAAERLRLLGA